MASHRSSSLRTTGTIAITGLLSRSYKFAVTGFPDFLAARAQGQDVVVLSSTYAGLGINVVLDKAIVARTNVTRNAPVEQRLKAVDGLLIAATGPNSTTRNFVRCGRESVGCQCPLHLYDLPGDALGA